MIPFLQPSISSSDQDIMRNWAKACGKGVRQRPSRHETTKHKGETLPFNMYETALQQGERPEFVPENEDQNEFSSLGNSFRSSFSGPGLRHKGSGKV